MKPAPTTEDDWTRFAGDLALCLCDLDEDEFLIISHKRSQYFVQFAAQGKFGMRAEAIGNNFILDPLALLTVEDYQQLVDLGWNRATNPPPMAWGEKEPPDGSPNFYVDLGPPVDFQALAAMAVRTLREVGQIRHPGELQYKCFAKDETQIRIPTLRIKRWRE